MTENKKQHSKQVVLQAVQLLKDQIRGLGWKYALFFASIVGFSLIMMLPPELFRFFTKSLPTLDQINGQAFLVQLLIFGGLVGTALLISSFGGTLCQEWLRLTLEAKLRREVMQAIHRMPLPVLDSAQRGEWLTRMTGDLHETEHFLTDSIPEQIRQLAILMGVAVLFLIHSGPMGALPLLTAVFLAGLNFFVQKRLAPVLRELRDLHGSVFQGLIESLEGIRTIRSHAVERYVHGRFDERLKQIVSKGLKMVRSLGFLMGSNQFVSQLLITLCLSVAALGMIEGALTIADVLIYPFYIGLFYRSAQQLANSAYDWNRYFTEGGRLAQLLYRHRSDKMLSEFQMAGDHVLSRSERMELQQVEIGYAGKRVAGPIDLSIRQGEIVAISGPSGCGKSTLLEVLAGLRSAQAGSLHLIDSLGRPLWASGGTGQPAIPLGLCAYVEQRPYIFEGSVRDNLTFGNRALATDLEIWNELQRAGLSRFVQSSGGLEYRLHDRGQNLSEGQRYRLALCRALLLKRSVLLLDEPFAALDQDSIKIVIETLLQEREVAAVVLVTHYIPNSLPLDGLYTFDKGLFKKQVKQNSGFYRVGEAKPNEAEKQGLLSTSQAVASVYDVTQGGHHDKGDRAKKHKLRG